MGMEFEMVAKTFMGLEDVLAQELTALGANNVEKGCRVVSGVEMFVGQACLQFKLFTGKRASASFMRSVVREALSSVHSDAE